MIIMEIFTQKDRFLIRFLSTKLRDHPDVADLLRGSMLLF